MTWVKAAPEATYPTPPAVKARRQQLLDRIVSAPGADAQRSEALDAIDEAGNFPVAIEPEHRVTDVTGLVRHMREHLIKFWPGEVTPC